MPPSAKSDFLSLRSVTMKRGNNHPYITRKLSVAKNYGRLAPPMPTYNMTEDARAVYKYLKSLEH